VALYEPQGFSYRIHCCSFSMKPIYPRVIAIN
jgi:hypothetical protein